MTFSTDKDGIAVIMCEIELEQKYKDLAQGKTILESSLHINLAEHLNSEIGLGTITDMNTAKDWLRASFLYQRMQRNPKYYAFSLEDKKTVRESVDDLVMRSIVQLEKTKLVNYVEDGGSNGKLTSTEYGIMTKVRYPLFSLSSPADFDLVLHPSCYGKDSSLLENARL
jgi:ATP-dependent DNA helicase HFM1/MER3